MECNVGVKGDLLLDHGEPVDITEPVMILDVVDSVDEVAIATRQVLLNHVR